MTQASDDSLARIESKLGVLTDDVDGLKTHVSGLETKLDKLETSMSLFDSKFSNYQQATRWVLQLAFTLIASATVTVIISTVR